MNSNRIGIHDLSYATGSFVMDLAELAARHGVDVAKYYDGIGQSSQTVLAVDEDIVTLAASAAKQIVDRHGSDRIRTVLLATETGIDQSKSAAIYVHALLNLPPASRVVELKQACYGATSALQLAAAMVSQNPDHHVLVIATDVARYDLDSSGEATQGAAAVAMLITPDPAIATIGQVSGLHTVNVMDFWRPNYRSTPIFDGPASISAYTYALEHAWKDYERGGGHSLTQFAAFCYHQPFTKMAYKAHRRLLELNGHDSDRNRLDEDLLYSTIYNRAIGNTYTASIYLALLSLLDNSPELSNETIGMFSYGSGSVAEFFSLTVTPGYQTHLRNHDNQRALDTRTPIDYSKYLELRQAAHAAESDSGLHPPQTRGQYRLAGISNDQRQYAGGGALR